ncbi:MAG: hypothetical protein LBC74_14735 [Planctomycetaceae bacterium]|jgi:hypothetical protein|nr:hypothetical protein [Planctomycetaceae bacterium]
METQKFDELHFFIAESGSFDNVRDTILIGGLLLFGKYDEDIQKKLRTIIVDSLKEIDKKYPQDTFFHKFLETAESKEQGKVFAAALAKNLAELTPNEEERTAYGIIMFQNIHDIYNNLPTLFAQHELDNKYISMIWSMIEHCVFVSDRTTKKLTEDAKFYIHAAARMYTIDLDKSALKSAKELQLNLKKIKDKNQKDTYIVTSPLNADEMRILFDLAIRNRWHSSKLQLASIKTEELVFDKKSQKDSESTPGLYLANTILGIERVRLVRSQLIAEQTLPIVASLIYDHNLDSTAICKSNYCNGNIDSLIATIEHYPPDPNSQQNQELVRILTKEFINNSKQFHHLFEAAKKLAYNSKNRKRVNDLARLLESIYRNSGKTDLFAELYLLLIPFLIANQNGNAAKSLELWRTYIPLENSLPKLDVEQGLTIGTEFRCRRAINLMEQFNFDSAEQIMIEIGTRNEDFCEAMAKFFKVPVEQINRRKIAACYDTLAQVFAFQAFDQYKRKLSELFFRKALALLDDSADQLSVWIHLGHLACDFPKQLKLLWDEVLTNLPTSGNYIEDGISMPSVVAVRLKGTLVFGSNDQKKEMAEAMDGITRSYAYEVINSFPYGLILQMLAMLNADIGNKKRANKLFEKAIRSLESGEQFARSLSIVAKLRHSLYNIAPNTTPVTSKNKFLHNNVRQFITKLPKSQTAKYQSEISNYIDPKDAQQHAKQIINNIRFIHW